MKKIISTILFLITTFIDIYTLTTIISEKIPLHEKTILMFIVINIIMISVTVLSIYDLIKLKKRSNIKVEDIVLTVVNHKNISRKKIKNLDVNLVEYYYQFKDNGFQAEIRFAGSSRKRIGKVKSISLNFSGDSNQTFDKIDAHAHDNNFDKEMEGIFDKNEGLNKNVTFEFYRPLKFNQQFDCTFYYKWDNCVDNTKDYIIAYPPFKYINTSNLNLKLTFLDKEVQKICAITFCNYTQKNKQINPKKFDKGEGLFEFNLPIEKDFDFAIAVFEFL